MQSGGKMAVCDSCGMQYSVERMREKVQEIRGIVSVEGTVRTQDADFIIRGGVLERYNGNDTHVVIPDSVVRIGQAAFRDCPGIKSVTFPHNVTEIATEAFLGCLSLENIKFSDTLMEIGSFAFSSCRSLEQITLPQTVKTIGIYAFSGCTNLRKINIPDQVEGGFLKLNGIFENCPALREIIISEEQKEKLFIKSLNGTRYLCEEIFKSSSDEGGYYGRVGPWCTNLERELLEERIRITQKERRAKGKCQHCGGSFAGIITKKCVRCGKPKDY